MKLALLPLVGLLFYVSLSPVCTMAAGNPTAGDTFVVQMDRERLTVRLKGVPLQMVMKAIAQKSGVVLVLDAPLEEKVTLAFEDLPLDEGLRRFPGLRNYVLVYAAAEPDQPAVLKQLKILATQHGGSRAKEDREEPPVTQWQRETLEDTDPGRRREAVEALASSEEPGRRQDLLLKVLKQDGNSEVRMAALDALASLDAISFEILFEVALQDSGPSVRMRALELLRERGEDDRRVKELLVMALESDPDKEVRETALSLLENFEIYSNNTRSGPRTGRRR